jgi:antitoxin Phd
MLDHWQLQDAKNRFSEVVKRALSKGPQIVTKRGVETVVVMSIKEYQKLIRPESDLVEFFRKSPMRGVELDLNRNKELAREIDL